MALLTSGKKAERPRRGGGRGLSRNRTVILLLLAVASLLYWTWPMAPNFNDDGASDAEKEAEIAASLSESQLNKMFKQSLLDEEMAKKQAVEDKLAAERMKEWKHRERERIKRKEKERLLYIKDNHGVDCTRLTLKKGIQDDGTIQPTRHLPVLTSSWVQRFNLKTRYMHMAMIERLWGRSNLVVAWQSGPATQINGKNGVAVEGLTQQRIFYALSTDGGKTWGAPIAIPVKARGPLWAPVLLLDKNGRLRMFYAESKVGSNCVRNSKPVTWEAGGDIKMIECGGSAAHTKLDDVRRALWSTPKTILSGEHHPDGLGMPRVIANKPVVTEDGEWILPYWREHNRDANYTLDKKECRLHADLDKLSPSHGALVSSDNGETWKPYGDLSDIRSPLMEGTGLQLPDGRVRMFFRTDTSCAFTATSPDGGATWTKPEPSGIPNPNTKFHVMGLEGVWNNTFIFPKQGLHSRPLKYEGVLIMAFNNHQRTYKDGWCFQCRTMLSLAVSLDGGKEWRVVAVLDSEEKPGVRSHYPTMVQSGSTLYIAYSRFYVNAEAGMLSPHQGIRVLTVDLTNLHWVLESAQRRTAPGTRAMEGVVDDYLNERAKSPGGLLPLLQMKWIDWSKAIASGYDVVSFGGADFVKKNKPLARYAREKLRERLKAAGQLPEDEEDEEGEGGAKPHAQQVGRAADIAAANLAKDAVEIRAQKVAENGDVDGFGDER